jgi:hypothetical protein
MTVDQSVKGLVTTLSSHQWLATNNLNSIFLWTGGVLHKWKWSVGFIHKASDGKFIRKRQKAGWSFYVGDFWYQD